MAPAMRALTIVMAISAPLAACASRAPAPPIPVVRIERVDGGGPVSVSAAAPEKPQGRPAFDCSAFGGPELAPPDARLFVTKAGLVCFGDERATDDADVEARARAFVAQHGVHGVQLFVDGSIPFARVVAV